MRITYLVYTVTKTIAFLCILTAHLWAAPKNIILMIGDGMGAQHIRAAALYTDGTDSSIMDSFSVQGWMSTFSIEGGYSPDSVAKDATYVRNKPTDSAASATALSTGVKTYDAAIGVDSSGMPLVTISEAASFLGKSTGVITSVPISHATPAGMAAHQLHRGSYSLIAQEIISHSKLDVILGGGHPYYNASGVLKDPGAWDFDYSGGPEFWNSLLSGTVTNLDKVPWTLVQTKGGIDSLAEGKGVIPASLLGIMPVFETLQQRRASAATTADEEPAPGTTPKIETTPTLSNLALAGLRVLSQNPNGFFVMIEGGAIDWASHSNMSARMIEETSDFLTTIKTVRSWIESNGGWDENLLVITSDHETGYLSDSLAIGKPIVGKGKGNLPRMQWFSMGHTNQLVRIVAQGPSSDQIMKNIQGVDPERGPYTDNALVGQFFQNLLQANWQFACKANR